MFTDAAVMEIARIAFERGTGARGLRSVVEKVMEGVVFHVAAGVRYVITDTTERGGEAVKQRMSLPRARLGFWVERRSATPIT
jgi:ATP-dependent Clp protease ATP-binding subunit ClpX